ncbi:MAG TPA: hypothetical protein VMT36_05575 [Candidatus Saccharimonadia bacterium]|nr:hypothetical protein [Candidatus Saccharimonadia bacterium]
MLRRFLMVGVSLGAVLTATYLVAVRPLWRHWGVDPAEAERALPGDDLVSQPTATDTRGLTIAAPPSAVWPWLVQMGFSRAGWYSYDAIDMSNKSAWEIHPEWQSLVVGDKVPTDPRGGFVVKHVDREKGLVLFYDTALMKEQLASADDAGVPAAPPNLRVTGRAMGSMTPPEFSISWAFVLEPTVDGNTRLIERFRLSGEMTGRAAAISGRMLGLGIFTMARKQMLGIQTRAERVARESTVLSSFATTIGHLPTADHPEEPEIRVRVKVQDLGSEPEPTTNGSNEVEPVKA